MVHKAKTTFILKTAYYQLQMYIYTMIRQQSDFKTYPDNLFISFIINFHWSNDFFNVAKNHIQMLIISLQSQIPNHIMRTIFAIGRVSSNFILKMHKKLPQPPPTPHTYTQPNPDPYCHQGQMTPCYRRMLFKVHIFFNRIGSYKIINLDKIYFWETQANWLNLISLAYSYGTELVGAQAAQFRT